MFYSVLLLGSTDFIEYFAYKRLSCWCRRITQQYKFFNGFISIRFYRLAPGNYNLRQIEITWHGIHLKTTALTCVSFSMDCFLAIDVAYEHCMHLEITG